MISFNVWLINFITEKIFVYVIRICMLLLPLEGRSRSVTGVVIILLIMTTTVAISIVLCVIVLFSYSVIVSISGMFFPFFFPSNVVTFSVNDWVLLGISKLVVFFWSVFYFMTSSSIFLLELGGCPVGLSSMIILV